MFSTSKNMGINGGTFNVRNAVAATERQQH